jgi:CelD/BcsL family acetyltransferase involved in cellulose biosynthesis
MLTIRRATNNDEKAWESYVFAHKEASFFHRFIWGRILEEGGIGKRLYFLAENKNEIVGIFPAFIVYKPILNIRCLPLSDYGSPLVSHPQVLTHLLKNIKRQLIKDFCVYLSFRAPKFLTFFNAIPKGYEKELSSYGIRLNISGDNVDRIWKEKISKKRRNRIRKAMKSNIDIKLGGATKDLIIYYKLYNDTMHRKGVSSANPKLFASIFRNLQPQRDFLIMLSEYDGRFIAGNLAFLFRDGIYLWGNVSSKEFLSLCPNDLLYWYLIEYACERGYNFVDFGPSSIHKDRTYLFKIQFGGEPFEIYDYYYSHFPILLKVRKIFKTMVSKRYLESDDNNTG